MSVKKTGGRYARVMGTLHRHTKAEKAGDAALGLLVRIWSYCADVGRHVLSERDMAGLLARDKNGPRKLKALLDTELLDKVEGGYSPRNWFTHNPGIRPSNHSDSPLPESGTRVDGEENVSGTRGEREENVSKPPERYQALTPPLSDLRFKIEESLRETESAGASPAALSRQVQLRFRKLHLASFSADPAMGGKNVGSFHTRLANTAQARSQDPLELLDQAFKQWADAGRPGLTKASPFSAFVARFDDFLPEMPQPQEESPRGFW